MPKSNISFLSTLNYDLSSKRNFNNKNKDEQSYSSPSSASEISDSEISGGNIAISSSLKLKKQSCDDDVGDGGTIFESSNNRKRYFATPPFNQNNNNNIFERHSSKESSQSNSTTIFSNNSSENQLNLRRNSFQHFGRSPIECRIEKYFTIVKHRRIKTPIVKLQPPSPHKLLLLSTETPKSSKILNGFQNNNENNISSSALLPQKANLPVSSKAMDRLWTTSLNFWATSPKSKVNLNDTKSSKIKKQPFSRHNTFSKYCDLSSPTRNLEIKSYKTPIISTNNTHKIKNKVTKKLDIEEDTSNQEISFSSSISSTPSEISNTSSLNINNNSQELISSSQISWKSSLSPPPPNQPLRNNKTKKLNKNDKEKYNDEIISNNELDCESSFKLPKQSSNKSKYFQNQDVLNNYDIILSQCFSNESSSAASETLPIDLKEEEEFKVLNTLSSDETKRFSKKLSFNEKKIIPDYDACGIEIITCKGSSSGPLLYDNNNSSINYEHCGGGGDDKNKEINSTYKDSFLLALNGSSSIENEQELTDSYLSNTEDEYFQENKHSLLDNKKSFSEELQKTSFFKKDIILSNKYKKSFIKNKDLKNQEVLENICILKDIRPMKSTLNQHNNNIIISEEQQNCSELNSDNILQNNLIMNEKELLLQEPSAVTHNSKIAATAADINIAVAEYKENSINNIDFLKAKKVSLSHPTINLHKDSTLLLSESESKDDFVVKKCSLSAADIDISTQIIEEIQVDSLINSSNSYKLTNNNKKTNKSSFNSATTVRIGLSKKQKTNQKSSLHTYLQRK